MRTGENNRQIGRLDVMAGIGVAILAGMSLSLTHAVATLPDARLGLGFEAGRSLVADCAAGAASFFTDRQRQSVYAVARHGAVVTLPLLRALPDAPIEAIDCLQHGEALAVRQKGQMRVYAVAGIGGRGLVARNRDKAAPGAAS